MRTHAAVCLPAALALVVLLASGAAAAGEGAAGDAGICEGCSSAVGTVNVTLVEPPPFTGMLLSAFDFRALSEALSGLLSAVSSVFFSA